MGKTVIRIAVGFIAVAAWALLGLSLHGGLEPPVDTRAHEESGRLLAQQALACLDSGGDITVIARDTGTFKNPASDIQLAAFFHAIAKAHATLHAVHTIQVDPLRPIAVPASDFREIIGNTPEGSVIVSFMGPPQLTAAERARLGESKPAIVAFCSGSLPEAPALRALFDQGLLRAAVVDRRGTQALKEGDGVGPSFVALTATNLTAFTAWQKAGRL
ncbi:MAG: hypothetical protein ACLQVY_21500 [Limisphaerales bacterium]